RLARLHLRTSDVYFVPHTYEMPKNALKGLLWGSPGGMSTCRLCMKYGTVMDAWHVVAECPAVEEERRSAIGRARQAAAGAGGRQARLVATLRAVERADPVDVRRQTFVFMATLGEPLPGGAAGGSGLPATWAQCLACPSSQVGYHDAAVVREARECAAFSVTIPAFNAFAVMLAQGDGTISMTLAADADSDLEAQADALRPTAT